VKLRNIWRNCDLTVVVFSWSVRNIWRNYDLTVGVFKAQKQLYSKLQARFLVREDALIAKRRTCQMKEEQDKIWWRIPKGGPIPRRTGRLTVSGKNNSNSNSNSKKKKKNLWSKVPDWARHQDLLTDWLPVAMYRWRWLGVGVRLVADSPSTSKSEYQASFWDPWPDFILHRPYPKVIDRGKHGPYPS
jgi:hypothetical protein